MSQTLLPNFNNILINSNGNGSNSPNSILLSNANNISSLNNHSINSAYDVKIKLQQSIKCSTTYELLKYEWIIFFSITILLLSTLDYQFNNLRIVLYCVLFMLLQTIRSSSKCLQIQDPLELSPIRKFSKEVSILLQINMTYLLFRILIEHHNIYSFLLFLHYTVVGMLNFERVKKNYQIQAQNPNMWKILTPLLLFIFAIIIDRNISQVSLIQLILLSFNLVLTVEIKMLLVNKECYIFGWEKQGYEGKTHLIFNKYQAIKKIIFTICAGIALQNIFFILPTMNQYASFTMFQSLILGGYTFYLYRKLQLKK